MRSLASLTVAKPLRVAGLLRKGLPVLLKKAETGSLSLHIPKVQNTYQFNPNMHFHHLPEVFVQFSGESDMTFPRQHLVHYPGTVSIIPRGVPHGERCRHQRGPFFDVVLMCQDGKLATHVSAEGGYQHPQILNFAQFKAANQDEYNRLLDRIVDEYHDRRMTRASRLKGLLITCLSELVEVVHGQEISPQKEHFKVGRCRQLVTAHLAEPDLSVTALAAWIKCSPDYLSSLFHQATGERLAAYINRQRALHARRLLETTALNISEVAWASGYSDPGYFIRIFKRIYEQTPKEFRKQLA